MKHFLIICCTNFLWLTVFGQVDYTGNYGFESKIYVDKSSTAKPTKDDQGHLGALTLFKINDSKYKFWLSANRGWPSYSNGNIDGMIDIVNNKAIFTKNMGFTDSACNISFNFYPKYVQVDQQSLDIDCGFGHNVFADGKYNKKDSRKITSKELKDFYIDVSAYKVIADKAILFKDDGGTIQTKQYFVQGNKVLGLQQNDEFVYIESITSSGKFVYGWLKKSDVTLAKK